MNDATYLWLNDAQAGPFTALQLRSMWTAGTITAATLCWQEGMEEWVPLGSAVEDAIEQEKLSEEKDAQRQQIAAERRMQKAAVDAKKEPPLKTRESLVLLLFSIFFSPIAFIVAIYYAVTGKNQRACWTGGCSMLFGTLIYFLRFFG